MSMLIAEIGVNWSDLSDAVEHIHLAAGAGFGFAKFQLFDESVIGNSDEAVQDELRKRVLNLSQAKTLVKAGKSAGVHVFFTAMYPGAMEIVLDTEVKFLKIRHKDLHNHNLWIGIQQSGWTGLRFYSTDDPGAAVSIGHVPLYCVPKYPATPEDYAPLLDRERWGEIRGRIGVSLHAPDKELFQKLFLLGAPAIEVHVKKDGGRGVLDDAVSVEFGEVWEWIREVRDADSVVVGQRASEPETIRPVKHNRKPAPKKERKWDIFKKRGHRRRSKSGKADK